MSELIHLQASQDQKVQTLVLDNPKGNIITGKLCTELRGKLEEAARVTEARLLVLRGAGGHFSYGAAVDEHLPEAAPAMLANLHGLVRDLLSFPYPTLAAVEGRCLGGGFEVALACGLLFASENSVLGCPEIRLGVFAPAATVLLSDRLPRPVVEELLLTGRTLNADEALRWGLANRVVPAPGEAHADLMAAEIERLVDDHLGHHSAASLRVAVRAIRSIYAGGQPYVRDGLDRVEELYIQELLPLHDGTEGIRAFLEKRPPRWTHA